MAALPENPKRSRAGMRWYRPLVVLAAFVLVAPGSARTDDETGVLALVSSGTTAELVRLDALSLEPVQGIPRVPVGLHDIPWAVSPDGSLIAFGSGRTGSVLFADLESMRALSRLRTGFTTALAWPTPERLLLLENRRTKVVVVVIDPIARRVLSRRGIGPGNPTAGALTGNGLAFLFAPQRRIGTPWLVILDAQGRTRRVVLRQISAGWSRSGGKAQPRRTWYRNPGLAVNVEDQRAYVVTAGSRVAEVDLATLGVSYHEARSVVAHAARARFPASAARASDGGNVLTAGTQRQAHWLGGGLIAVAGWNDLVARDPNGRWIQTDEPAGLSVLDVRDWTLRSVATDARWFHAAGDQILAQRTPARRPGTALAAFSRDGTPRFRLELRTIAFGFQSAGYFVYLGLSDEYRSHQVTVVDTRTGQVAARPRAPGWVLLVSATQPQFCWCYTGTTVG